MMDETLQRKVLITGGAGFIDSNGASYHFNNYSVYENSNLDILISSLNIANLKT